MARKGRVDRGLVPPPYILHCLCIFRMLQLHIV